MPAVETTLETFVSPDELKEVILDLEGYPEFMKEVTKVEILERDDHTILAVFHIDLSFGGFTIQSHYTVRYTIGDDEISWELEGSPVLTKNEGSWKLEETDDGETVATYRAEIETNTPIPPEVQAEFIRQELPKLMEKIRDRAEGMD